MKQVTDAPWRVVGKMIRALDRVFGGAARDRRRKPPDVLDSLMRTILSQNTTDENRDRAYERLRERFPTWEAVMEARPGEVKDAIRVAGLANQKGPNMQAFLRWLKSKRGELSLDFIRDLPEDRAIRTLTRHRGVGIKTAYIVLAFACDMDLCAVDTHVHRILRRVGIIDEGCSREKAHTELAPLIPKGKARAFHVNLIDFGKTICTARNPACETCPIARMCRYYQMGRKG